MAGYVEFKKILDWVKTTNSDRNITRENISRRLPALRKHYKKLNVTNDDNIVNLELQKCMNTEREVETFLETSQVYELNDKLKYLLMLTKNPNSKQKELFNQIRLPYPQIFIDVSFLGDDIDNYEKKITGILLREMKEIQPKWSIDEKNLNVRFHYGLTAYIAGVNSDNAPFIDTIHFPIASENLKGEEEKNVNIIYDNKGEANFIKKFVINFLLFLKDREVIYVHNPRSNKNKERRIKQGKIPIPSSNVIKLTGQLKRYVDGLQDSDFKGKLDYQFWVCGHWRNYRSEKFTYVKGKVVWIEPYKKGKGMIVNHVYRVIGDDDDDDVVDYDDIEPLKKPLRQMRK